MALLLGSAPFPLPGTDWTTSGLQPKAGASSSLLHRTLESIGIRLPAQEERDGEEDYVAAELRRMQAELRSEELAIQEHLETLYVRVLSSDLTAALKVPLASASARPPTNPLR
jgi:hypothetical protein